MLFPKLTLTLCVEYKIVLSTIYPYLLLCKALPKNTIYEMKVCLNINGVFKLFEMIILAKFHD